MSPLLVIASIEPLWKIAQHIGLVALICGIPLIGFGLFKRRIPTALGGWVVATVSGTLFGLFVGCLVAVFFMIILSAMKTPAAQREESKTDEVEY